MRAIEAEAPLRRQIHDAKLQNEELQRQLDGEQRRRHEGTDRYQVLSVRLPAPGVSCTTVSSHLSSFVI